MKRSKDQCTQNVVMQYPAVEYGPEVDAALERVLEVQAALRDAGLQALQAQGLHGFLILGECFDREAYMNLLEEPRRALQQAKEHLSEVSVRACEKAGCYDRI